MRRKVWIAVGVFTFLCILAGALLPALQPAREHGHPPMCRSILRQISYTLQFYSSDHDEDFPPSLGALFPEYISDGELFLCPVAGKAEEIRLTDLSEGATDASAVWGERFTDYAYVPGLRASAPSDAVVAYDRDGNHEGGRWAVSIDGRATWMTEPEFRAALAETEAWLKAHPRPTQAVEDDQF